MKTLLKSQSLSSGFALFSMFFGAGNLIFPLALGQMAGDLNFYAMLGLILTAVIVPLIGVIAILLFDGDYHSFFAKLGKWPGFAVALTIITLLGPLGSTPRCIALSFSTVKSFFPGTSAVIFSAISCVVVFLFTVRRNRVIEILGRFLTPILLLGLGFIIFKGFMTEGTAEESQVARMNLFLHGLKEGYNTMDLLAAFFFSSSIIMMLKNKNGEGEDVSHVRRTLKATFIGGGLLALVYLGFSYIASVHASSLEISGKEQILTALALKVAGPFAGIVLCITVALTCLTTAIALISVFADFVKTRVFQDKVRYELILIGSLLITFLIANIEFKGISAFLGPILEVCYPGLIVLSIGSIASHFVDFKPIKFLVFIAFICSTVIYFY